MALRPPHQDNIAIRYREGVRAILLKRDPHCGPMFDVTRDFDFATYTLRMRLSTEDQTMHEVRQVVTEEELVDANFNVMDAKVMEMCRELLTVLDAPPVLVMDEGRRPLSFRDIYGPFDEAYDYE